METRSYRKFFKLAYKYRKDDYYSFLDEECYHEEKYRGIVEPSVDNNYWIKFLGRKGFFDFTKDEAKHIIDSRLNFLADYYERLLTDKLTHEELNKPKPSHFRGPYLPTLKDLKKMRKCRISENDFEVQGKFASFPHEITERINFKHRERVLSRWLEFQKEFGIYDLRPLIGSRCGFVLKDEEKFHFFWYRCFNKIQFEAFLQYIRKPFPHLVKRQVISVLNSICDYYSNGEFLFNCSTPMFLSGLEYRLMYEIYDCFGDTTHITKILELLIGKRSAEKYHRVALICFLRRIPFHDKKWSKDEEILLIKTVQEYSGITDLKSLLHTKEKVFWPEIGMKLKYRKYDIYKRQYDRLKQRMLDAIYKREERKYKSQWTSGMTVKLIELVYESNANSMRGVNWEAISQHFSGCSNYYVSHVFGDLCNRKVPYNKRKTFNEIVEYLYHKIKPVYQLNDVKRRKRKCDLDLLTSFESSTMTAEEKKRLDDIFLRDDDVYNDNELLSLEYFENESLDTDGDSSCEENMREQLWEKELEETVLEEFERFRRKSRVLTNFDHDILFWQELMKRANYDCNYSAELERKLRIVDMSKYDYDSTSAFECSSVNSFTVPNSRLNTYRKKSSKNKRDTDVSFQTSDSSVQNRSYIFPSENRYRVAFGRKRKRSSTDKTMHYHSDSSINTPPKYNFSKRLRKSESFYNEEKDGSFVEVVTLSSEDEINSPAVLKSKKIRRKRRRRLHKENINNGQSLLSNTSNNYNEDVENSSFTLITKPYKEEVILAKQNSENGFNNPSVSSYNCDSKNRSAEARKHKRQKEHYDATDELNQRIDKGNLSLEMKETKQNSEDIFNKPSISYIYNCEMQEKSRFHKKKKKRRKKNKIIVHRMN